MTTSQRQAHKTVSVIIPTRNGAATLDDLLTMLARQTTSFAEVLVVDSSSDDDSVAIARRHGAEVTVIPQSGFDHGGTRTMMAERARGDILLFLTQDAVPAGADAAQKLLAPLLADEGVVVSYGRQLPSPGASPFAAHLRLFNYPPRSRIRSLEDRAELGLKTAFASNSFAAYKKSALAEAGYFQTGLIFGEDACAVGRLLLRGWKVAYVAEAEVYHSHNYNWRQEFRRSFDIGVLHVTEQWLLDTYGRAEGHGLRYVRSELASLMSLGKLRLLPSSLIRNGLKYAGYRLGRQYKNLPQALVPHLSMHRQWWNTRGGS